MGFFKCNLSRKIQTQHPPQMKGNAWLCHSTESPDPIVRTAS